MELTPGVAEAVSLCAVDKSLNSQVLYIVKLVGTLLLDLLRMLLIPLVFSSIIVGVANL